MRYPSPVRITGGGSTYPTVKSRRSIPEQNLPPLDQEPAPLTYSVYPLLIPDGLRIFWAIAALDRLLQGGEELKVGEMSADRRRLERREV